MAEKRKRKEENAWLEADRKHRRTIVITALVVLLLILGGIFALVHSFTSR